MDPLSSLAPLLLVITSSGVDLSVARGIERWDSSVHAVAMPARRAPAQPIAESDTDDASHAFVIPPGGEVALGAVRVAVGNISPAEYTPPGEPTRRGLTAQLSIRVDGERRAHRRIYPGAAFHAGGHRFSVASIDRTAVRLVVLRD